MTEGTMTKGEAISYLGQNASFFVKNPQINDWLSKQKDVVIEPRRSAIPNEVVDKLRSEFNIEPIKRRPRKSKTSSSPRRSEGGSQKDLPTLHALIAEATQREKETRKAHDEAKADLRAAKSSYRSAYDLVATNIEALQNLPKPE